MIGDTIHAVGSPPGMGARGVLRISGPDARAAVARMLADDPALPPERHELPPARATYEGAVIVAGHRVPCLVLVMPAPASYTGEDVVELHLPASPLLLETVGRQLGPGCRLATPGEFTRRAFENGKLDLAASEAVLHLIEAASDTDRRFALDVLRGGLGRSVDRLRDRIQDALALLEAGLDFTAGETGSVEQEAWLPTLRQVEAELAQLLSGIPTAGVQGELLVLGAANAGKSSLVNALLGREQVLVADQAGTTRDVLAVDLPCEGGGTVRLLDGPGDLRHPGDIEQDALALRDRLAGRAAGAVLVVDLTRPVLPATGLPVVAVVGTKLDLCPDLRPDGVVPAPPADAPVFLVSNTQGTGIPALRGFLSRQAMASPRGLQGRVHDVLQDARTALRRALDVASAAAPEELVAVDLQGALRALERIHGHGSPDDLLDRIFARFCLGK